MSSRFTDLFSSLQRQLKTELESDRQVHQHPVAKGEASEYGWVELFSAHLPNRYEVNSAFIIDSSGNTSDQIDVVVYDHQYTPIWYNQKGQRFIPAESVYAVFEVKQSLNKQNVEYAGEKAASVRQLKRTSYRIIHAGGEHEPRELFDIIAGILSYDSDWTPPFGESLIAALESLDDGYLNIGCAVANGAFEVQYEGGTIDLNIKRGDDTLIFFMLSLLHRLQALGTVPAIDYNAYSSHFS